MNTRTGICEYEYKYKYLSHTGVPSLSIERYCSTKKCNGLFIINVVTRNGQSTYHKAMKKKK